MKIIKVESCWKCPYLRHGTNISYRCKKTRVPVIICDFNEPFIHCTCPLQSKEDFIKDEIEDSMRKIHEDNILHLR